MHLDLFVLQFIVFEKGSKRLKKFFLIGFGIILHRFLFLKNEKEERLLTSTKKEFLKKR